MARTICLIIGLLLFNAQAEQVCANCHQSQVADWQSSHHFHAMEKATLTTVLGDFNNQKIEYEGQTALFFTKNNAPYVKMPNLAGVLTEYPVLYTFGYEPLQQYMFDMGQGHIQLFPFAWDSRSKAAGGQRWFVLHPEQQKHDLFHWSQKGQNWNHMCADCHSTDFKKNFDLQSNTFNSSFSAINVSCQACHGDTQNHLQWAEGNEKITNKGFAINIKKQTPLFIPQADGSMKSATPLSPSKQVQVCASCHARRSQLADRQGPDGFMQQFQGSLITPELYHVDGQIWDEDYVWGSFLQSKMYRAGVTCSNCHNPHSGKLKFDGNQTCTQCHSQTTYDTPKHHGHPLSTDASQCVNCHMPETTYMQVDPRRDHSFHIPRPDLSAKTNTPNVCTQCHSDKSSQWASNTIKKWHPNTKSVGTKHFAQAFYAADQGLPDASVMLSKIAQNKEYADIIRASALARMAQTPDRNAVVAIARAVRDDEPLKRLGAIQAAENFSITEKYRMLKPLLDDPHKIIRAEAGRSLAAMLIQPFPTAVSGEAKQQLESAVNEYKLAQRYQAERGFSHTNLGNLALTLGKPKQSEQHFLKSIAIEAIYEPAYVNLADLYRVQQDESKAQQVLQQGFKVNAYSVPLNYAYAMSLIRTGEKQTALKYLATAANSTQAPASYIYTHALLLEDLGQNQQAQSQLLKALQLNPNNPDISYSLVQSYIKAKQYKQAYQYAKHLQTLVPGNAQIEQLVSQLQMMISVSP